jgi:hypothetical protein
VKHIILFRRRIGVVVGGGGGGGGGVEDDLGKCAHKKLFSHKKKKLYLDDNKG